MIVSAVSLLLVLPGCGSRISETLSLSNANLETRLASTTELLIDDMVDTYDKVQTFAFDSEFDGVVAGILASSADRYEPSPLISDTLRAKIQILNLYKQLVHEYALLADDGFTGKLGPFANCSNAILDAYTRLDDSIAQACSQQVLPLIRSSRYDKNAVAVQLIEALSAMWKKDAETWSGRLNTSFLDYQTTLSMIPDDAFDEDKLAKYVSAPYNGKHNLAEVYKVELIKERRNMLNALVKKQVNVTFGLQYLQHALTEFVKNNGENDVVLNYLKRIELLINRTDTTPEQK